MDVRWRPPLVVAIVTHLVTQSFVRARMACWPGTLSLRTCMLVLAVQSTVSTLWSWGVGLYPARSMRPTGRARRSADLGIWHLVVSDCACQRPCAVLLYFLLYGAGV